MSETTFNRCSADVLTAIKAGASIADAARQGGCAPRTVDRWLVRGRTEPSGTCGRFAAQVDAARREQGLPGTDEAQLMSAAELKQLATRAARNGSVAAMRLMHTLQSESPEKQGPDQVDALVARRNARRARGRRGSGKKP